VSLLRRRLHDDPDAPALSSSGAARALAGACGALGYKIAHAMASDIDRLTHPQHPERVASGTRAEERAIRVAMICSVAFAVAKLAAGAATGSMSLISSAIDSLGDLIVSTANLFVIRYGDQPPDDEHNYGHAKVEGLGAMFEGGFIFAAGLFIVYESIHKALIGEHTHDSALGIAVMLPILGVTIWTVTYLRRVARQTGSLVVKSDAVHYTTDVWVNVGVLASLVLVKITGQPLVDTFISIGIALFMIRSSIGVVREGFDVVMDRSLEGPLVERVVTLLGRHPAIESFHDFKTRRGKIPHVDFHVVVRPEMTAKELHDLFLGLRRDVRAIVGPSTKLLVHADPAPSDSGGPEVARPI
jgi:cation diffusion facilitator family transporter